MTAFEEQSTVVPARDDTIPRPGSPDGEVGRGEGALSSTEAPTASTVSYRSAFPPIDDYAFLSDCETTCLIARNGSVEWMCVPRPDSPSVFGAVLDRSAGHFRVGPYGQSVPAARRYLPGGLIVETTWQTETGWLIVRDALVMGPWHNTDQRSRTHRRAPSDWDAEHILLRTVKCVSGTVELEMSCEPAFDTTGLLRAGSTPARSTRKPLRRARRVRSVTNRHSSSPPTSASESRAARRGHVPE